MTREVSKQRVADAIKNSGMCNREIAIASGLSEPHVSRLANKKTGIGRATAVKMGRLLGYSADWLMGEDDGRPDIYGVLSEKYGAVMSPDDVAQVLKRHPVNVREMCKDGTIPAARIGRRWYVLTSNLASMLEGDGV